MRKFGGIPSPLAASGCDLKFESGGKRSARSKRVRNAQVFVHAIVHGRATFFLHEMDARPCGYHARAPNGTHRTPVSHHIEKTAHASRKLGFGIVI